MRTTMKGGVWKNSEDEILKAAVMKYGLNNWSRVASLLVRKSAKQCKSRWYEWLDPSVKKTEWCRDEEEKLLHLAKLFPNQWRTIAPIVGRTAHQCLEHYDKLLDRAQGRTEEDRLNDPRRLRPGEIDPHPETKPSRADAVDMEDDEKEMLAEARARLANTRGKKAKRKAREKQLDEARRLAALQKRRELKAAGIGGGRWRRRNETMDYANEIPFEQPAPKGFYAIGAEETPGSVRGFANMNLQQLEGQRRAEDEKRLRKEDTRKLKRMMTDNLPEAMKMIEKLNEPQSFRKRTKLSLPAPQLTDVELDEIMQIGMEASIPLNSNIVASHSGQLLSDDKARRPLPQMTPIRTPLAENTVLLEAQNALARTMASTPLDGGEYPTLHNVVLGTGATPIHQIPKTPNPLGMSVLKGIPSDTPLIGHRPGATPLRDHLSLNENGAQGIQAIDAMLQMQVRSSLANLPAPQNEIEVAVPDTSELPASPPIQIDIEEDAEDAEKRKQRDFELEQQLLFKKNTQVIQKNLPRPLFPQSVSFSSSNYNKFKGTGCDYLCQSEDLLHNELISLLINDACKFPLPVKGLKIPTNVPSLDSFELNELADAAAMIHVESLTIQEACGMTSETFDINDMSELRRAWDETLTRAFVFDTVKRVYISEAEASHDIRLAAMKARYDELKAQLIKDSQKSKKLENKLIMITKGYTQKSQQLLKSIDDSWSEAITLGTDLIGFQELEKNEARGLQKRKHALQELLQTEKNRHQKLQGIFSTLSSTRDSLRRQILIANEQIVINGVTA